jgi:outer membrane protein OmpA-like peptidoglycan-associated protein
VSEGRVAAARGRSPGHGRLRKRLFRWSAAAASVAVTTGLMGCGGGGGANAATEAAGALAVVVGSHSNMPPPVLAGRAASVVDMAVGQQSRFSLIVADGAPFQETTTGLPQRADRRAIEEAVTAARAQTAESDLLGALHLAAGALAGQRGLRTLVVLDSGLSTAGALRFTTPGTLDAHPQELAETLGDAHQLPDLSGVSVVFQGLGDTAAPQQPLDPIRRAQLVAIWSAVARQAGATSVQVERTSLEGTPLEGDPAAPAMPPVTPVETDAGYRCAGTTMTLSGGPFAYRPNSDDLLDPAAAVGVLRGIAEQLIAGQIVSILYGTTATIGEPADRVRFSDQRAQAVADLLIELGVPIPQLHVEGLGSDFPGYIVDRDDEGRLMPAAAALNRTVFIEFTAPVVCG